MSRFLHLSIKNARNSEAKERKESFKNIVCELGCDWEGKWECRAGGDSAKLSLYVAFRLPPLGSDGKVPPLKAARVEHED